jgi:AraC family transcriptional regulator, activator of mtrCDE
MLLERLLDNLAVHVEPFARCEVASGCCLRLRDLGWVTLHFVLQGQGAVLAGAGRSYPLRPGTLAVIPARMSHSIQHGDGRHVTSVSGADRRGQDGLMRYLAGPSGEHATASVDGRPAGEDLVIACGELEALLGHGLGLFDLLTEPVVVDLSDNDDIMATFRQMLEESAKQAPGSRAMLDALMNACLVQLFRALCDDSDCALPWLDALQDPRMAVVLETLLASPERAHSLESLAETAAMSRSTFAEAFKACFGRAPMTFLREVRLRRGAELLRDTDLTVERVAHRVGFSSRSHVSSSFTEQFGRSPTEMRSGG